MTEPTEPAEADDDTRRQEAIREIADSIQSTGTVSENPEE